MLYSRRRSTGAQASLDRGDDERRVGDVREAEGAVREAQEQEAARSEKVAAIEPPRLAVRLARAVVNGGRRSGLPNRAVAHPSNQR